MRYITYLGGMRRWNRVRFVTAGGVWLVFTQRMEIPYLAQRVRVRGSDTVYFVTSVDEEQQTVNLLPVWGSKGSALDGVAFSDLIMTKLPTAKGK